MPADLTELMQSVFFKALPFLTDPGGLGGEVGAFRGLPHGWRDCGSLSYLFTRPHGFGFRLGFGSVRGGPVADPLAQPSEDLIHEMLLMIHECILENTL